MENNKAFVATIGNIRPIEAADRIVQASIMLNGVPITNVVVGTDSFEGQEVVYFDSNMCLEESTILKDYPDLQRYLSKRGRVKTIKLRGVYSDGLTVSVYNFFKYFSNDQEAQEFLFHGRSFTDLGDTHICHKYVVPQQQSSARSKSAKGGKGKKISRLIPDQFRFHIDTDQLARNMDHVSPLDVISITGKIHGTSAICARVLVKRKLSIVERVLKYLGVKVCETEYDILYSSRRVIKNDAPSTGFYSSDVWSEAGKTFSDNLSAGETAYFEIYGYLPGSQSMIQKGYDYGCKPGEYGISLYRMTKTGLDGDVTEYSWPMVKDRAKRYGIPHVPEYYFGRAQDHFPDIPVDENWRSNFLERLRETYLEKDLEGNLCAKVPDEGIVLRVESGDVEVYKLKSMRFLKHETDMHESGEADLEETDEG